VTNSPPAPTPPAALHLPAVHLRGVPQLAGGQAVELRLSAAGLHIVRSDTGATVGQVQRRQIASLALGRGRWRGLRARIPVLIVTSDGGQARFELRDLTSEQIDRHLEPLLAELNRS
jgi:hypothetical protein